MSEESFVVYLKRQIVVYRVFALLTIFIILVSWAFNIDIKIFGFIYYSLSVLALYAFDEIFYRLVKNKKCNARIYYIKGFIYFILATVGSIFFTLPVYLEVLYIVFGLLIIIESQFLDDVFNHEKGNIISVIYIILLMASMLIRNKDSLDIAFVFLMFIASVLVYIVTYLAKYILRYIATEWNNKYNDVLFYSQDIQKENEKLTVLQERISEVNNTINLQKIELTETNSTLKKKNAETRSLMDVMVKYTTTFDVEEDINYMLESITDVKNSSLCCMYIDSDVVLNEEPIFVLQSTQNYAPEPIRKETKAVYDMIVKENIHKPVEICTNFTQNYQFFNRKGCCITAFPAYEGDKIYGVLIVASDKYDFFYGGYDFYMSTVLNFTSAMIGDRLYMKTEDMAKKDGLTKIYNRIYFNICFTEMLNDIKANGGTISVTMLDIDHFKNVNDTYGHLAGDEAIKAVAKMCNDTAKKYGLMPVRFGGEEFLLIMNGVGKDRAYEITDELHENIKNYVVHFEGQDIKLNTSVGVANYPETVDDPDKVLDRSDKAMYYGKTHGRGRIIIDGTQDPNAPEFES